MKHLLLLLLVFGFSEAFAQQASLYRPAFQKKSGTLRTSNWRPDSNTASPKPSISSIAVKWEVSPKEGSCELKMSMQWYLGSKVYYRGKEFTSPIITSQEMKNFSLITLELSAAVYEGSTYLGKIVFDMGKTPPAGGTWGSDIKQTRSWSSIMKGKSAEEAKALMSRNYTLSKLTIEKVEFGGMQPFKNAAFDKFYRQAQQFQAKNDLQRAIDFYGFAADLNTSRSSDAATKKSVLAARLKKFYDYLKKGHNRFNRKEYSMALENYEEALEIIPNDEKAAKRIREINAIKERFEQADRDAVSTLQNAQDWRAVRRAEGMFKEALSIMPVDKKEYIAERLEEVESALDRAYNGFLTQGERAFQAKDYVQAARAFKEGTLIYPNKAEAKEKLKETENAVLAIINKKYADKVSEAVFSRNQFYESAAKTLDQASEGCYVEKAQYYQCFVDFYNGLRANANQEMRAELYNEQYIIQRPSCFEGGCQPMSNKTSGSAADYLTAAHRKDGLFQEYGNASFQQYRDTYLDKAIKLNPRNPEAFTFKAELAMTSIEKMEWLNKALSVNAQYQPAIEAKNNIQGDFSSEVFDRIEEGDLEYLKRAVSNNLLRNIASYQNYDVLEYAIIKEQVPALAYLLQYKTKLHSTTVSNANQLLYKAIAHRSAKSLEYLIDVKKADVNFQKEGQDPLIVLATSNNDYAIVQKLLASGADIYRVGASNKTALDLAVEQDYPPIVELLLSRYTRSLPDEYIFMAVNNNSSPVLGHLFRKGARLDARDAEGNTPLHVAVQQKFSGISQTLVSRGAGINTQNNIGDTPLLLACKNGLAALGQILLEGRADIDLANKRSETPFYWAVKNNMDEMASQLLQQQAKTAPALALAKDRSERELVENLAYCVAQFGIAGSRLSLVELAVDYFSGIGFLEGNGKENLLVLAIKNDNLEAFKELIANQEERKTNTNGYSAMHLAVMQKSVKFTQYLLDNLINTKAIDNQGASPLHRAIQVGFYEPFNLLVNRFNMNGQDNAGMTPLHYAVNARSQQGVALLLQQGANKKIKDNRKWNPKKLARKKRYKTIKKML